MSITSDDQDKTAVETTAETTVQDAPGSPIVAEPGPTIPWFERPPQRGRRRKRSAAAPPPAPSLYKVDPVAWPLCLVRALKRSSVTDLRQIAARTYGEVGRMPGFRDGGKARRELDEAMARAGLTYRTTKGKPRTPNREAGGTIHRQNTRGSLPLPPPLPQSPQPPPNFSHAPADPKTRVEVVDRTADLQFYGVAGQALRELVYGDSREELIVGARGDGKTVTALGGMVMHAQEHHKRGFKLPTVWMSVRDFHQRHKTTTIRSMKMDFWQGLWQFRDDEKEARAIVQGQVLCEVYLFGVEDKGAQEKLKMRVHGLHFEEAAPSGVLVDSSGVDEASWIMAMTSQGLPSYKHPAVITENYPDEDHWTWQRFVIRQMPGTRYFRIPPGERASAEDRAEWARSTAGRPDLYDRLVAGKPGGLLLGDPVTGEYREAVHYRPAAWAPPASGAVWLGFDYWHHPAGVVGIPMPLGQLRIPFAKRKDNADIGALMEEEVCPYLTRARLFDRPLYATGDPSGETGDQSDLSKTAMRRMLAYLPKGTQVVRVTNDDDAREAVVKQHLRRMLSDGSPALLLCGPESWELHKAWSGGWHKAKSGRVVKTGPEGAHSHVADAAAYLCLGFFGNPLAGKNALQKWRQQTAYTQPWDGQTDGPSRSPALVGATPFDKAKWVKQYQEEGGR